MGSKYAQYQYMWCALNIFGKIFWCCACIKKPRGSYEDGGKGHANIFIDDGRG